MNLYTVFIWWQATSPAAEICESLWAEDAQDAAFAVMRLHQLSYAAYVWVVHEDPDDPTAQDANFYHLVLGASGAAASAPSPGQEVS